MVEIVTEAEVICNDSERNSMNKIYLKNALAYKSLFFTDNTFIDKFEKNQHKCKMEEMLMKATGIVRRIDDLGRVVIPKEIRRTLRIREGDPLEIFTGREGEIILKKYSPIGEMGVFARQYAESLSQTAGVLACVCDKDQILAASGTGKKEFQEKTISRELERVIDAREQVQALANEKKYTIIIEGMRESYKSEVICPIISEGDAIGAVILLGKEDQLSGETALKLAQCAAAFLGRQMES